MRSRLLITFVCSALFVSLGCQQRQAVVAAPVNGPQATIMLRDGSRVSGEVLATSPAQLTLKALDGTTRVLDMQNVRAVDYGPPAYQTGNPGVSNYVAGNISGSTTAPLVRRERAHNDGMPTPPRYHPDESHISSATLLLPAGTRVEVRTDENIDARNASQGQTYAAEIYRDVTDQNGEVVLPQGANAQLALRSATRGGRFQGADDLLIDLASVSVGGRRYVVVSSDVERRGNQGLGANKRTLEYVGGVSALGAVIGALAGQGKGAAIGAASGAGAGAVAELATKGGGIRIPAETILTFQSEQPLRIAPAR